MRHDLTRSVIGCQPELIRQHAAHKELRKKMREYNELRKKMQKSRVLSPQEPQKTVCKVRSSKPNGVDSAAKKSAKSPFKKKKKAIYGPRDLDTHVVFYHSLERFILLGGSVSFSQRCGKLNLILCEVLDKYNINLSSLKTRRSLGGLGHARQEYCYRAYNETGATLKRIGDLIARHHSGVIYQIGAYGVRCNVETPYNDVYLKTATYPAQEKEVV